MEELDPKSYKLLKRLYKFHDYIDLSSYPRETKCLYKFVYREPIGRDKAGGVIYSDRYKINDYGVEYILKQRSETLGKWKPLIISYVISLIAIIISLIALIK